MKTTLLAIVIGLQTAWVIGTVAVQEQQLAHGNVILLETRPVDPRDLLRGDYVILGYDFSSVPVTKFTPPVPDSNLLTPGRDVFAELKPDGAFHRLDRVSLEPVVPQPGNVVLRGKLRWQWQPANQAVTEVSVAYGLEQYFVREGTGNPRGKLTVEVSVPVSGHALIKQVYLDGVPYAQAIRAQQ